MGKKLSLILCALTFLFVAVGCQNAVNEPVDGLLHIGTEEVFNAAQDEEAVTWVEEFSRIEGVHYETFGEYDIYVIALGEKPTGGYEVLPGETIFKEAEKLQFEAIIIEPAPGEMVTQAITYPNLVFAVAQGIDVNVVYTEIVREIEVEDRQGINLLDEVDIEGEGQYVQLKFVDKGNIFEGVILVNGKTSAEKLKFTLEDGHNTYVEEDVSINLVDGTSSFTIELPMPQVEGFLMMAILAEVDGLWTDDVIVPIN